MLNDSEAEQPAERIEGGGHMDVSMGVDTTGHTTRRASTVVMVIPSLKVLRDGTAVPDRSDGRSGLF